VVTTGCGQGSVFGGLMDDVDQHRLPPQARLRQSQLYDIVNTIRLQRQHLQDRRLGARLRAVRDAELLLFVEDVGRHNAVDTIAGWMWLCRTRALDGGDKVFYTTGRLTSEMVIKSAQMGVPVVVSRSGITANGAGRGAARGPVRHRPRHAPALSVLLAPAAHRLRRSAQPGGINSRQRPPWSGGLSTSERFRTP
jgi:formate dehydrogenase accessory protein FdhD